MNIRYLITILSVAFMMFLFQNPVFALRCHGSIVSPGDTKSQVIQKCGEPTHVESWEEKRLTEDEFYFRYRRHQSEKKYYRPLIAKNTIKIEEWTYNFGPTKHIRYLLFEKGRLKSIKTGEKGYVMP